MFKTLFKSEALKNLWNYLSIIVFCLSSFTPQWMINVPLQQLTEDKFCLVDYGFDREFCKTMDSARFHGDPRKNDVLKSSTSFQNIFNILTTIVSIISVSMIGNLMDTRKDYLRLLLIIPRVGQIFIAAIYIVNAYFFQLGPRSLLLSLIPMALSGGGTAFFSTSYMYASIKTTAETRFLGIALVVLTLTASKSLANLLNGLLIGLDPFLFESQLRNYFGVFGISILGLIFCITWTLMTVGKASRNYEKIEPTTEEAKEAKVINLDDQERQPILENRKVSSPSMLRKLIAILRDVITLQGPRKVASILFVPRARNGRLKLILIVFSTAIVIFQDFQEGMILFQYVQTVFNWNAAFYSNISSLTSFAPFLATLIFSTLFKKIFILSEPVFALILLILEAFGGVIRGSFLNPIGFFVSVALDSPRSLTLSLVKTIAANLVEPNELGCVYTVISLVTSIISMIASSITTFLFNTFLEVNPGLIWDFAAILLVIPIFTVIWVKLSSKS